MVVFKKILDMFCFADDNRVCRDQGGQDKSTSNPANFLGEVLLNIGKLKPWDGIILEQVFELRQVACRVGCV